MTRVGDSSRPGFRVAMEFLVRFADRRDIADGQALDLDRIGYFHTVDVVEQGV